MPDPEMVQCPVCFGAGMVDLVVTDNLHPLIEVVLIQCDKCRGTGRILRERERGERGE